jgi:hypothetical protein
MEQYGMRTGAPAASPASAAALAAEMETLRLENAKLRGMLGAGGAGAHGTWLCAVRPLSTRLDANAVPH